MDLLLLPIFYCDVFIEVKKSFKLKNELFYDLTFFNGRWQQPFGKHP